MHISITTCCHTRGRRTNAPFPSAFLFLNTYVCSNCAALHHNAAHNQSIEEALNVSQQGSGGRDVSELFGSYGLWGNM